MMDHWIKEYDLKQAAISILVENGAIPEELYHQLSNMPKNDRVVFVGKYMKDHPDLLNILKDGMIQARGEFLEANNISDDQVLYIDNDSITILEPKSISIEDHLVTQFGSYLQFRIKHIYSLMFRLGPIDFLYYRDHQTEHFRIKYANQQLMQEKHKNGFLEFLLALAAEAEEHQGHGLDTLQMLKDTYCRYTSHELCSDFYREFNPRSQFRLKPGGAYVYYTEVPPGGLANVDISYNANLMMQLSRYLHAEYFKRSR